MMILTMIAPAMANSFDNQTFESQVFHTQADTPMQLAELSQKEMKEAEGAMAPLVALGYLTVIGTFVAARYATPVVRGLIFFMDANWLRLQNN